MSTGSLSRTNRVPTSAVLVSTMANSPTPATNSVLTSTIAASVDDQSVDAVTTLVVTVTRPGTTVRVSPESSSSALSVRPSVLATMSHLEACGIRYIRMNQFSDKSQPTSTPHSPSASGQDSGNTLAVTLPLAMLLVIVTTLASFLLLDRCPRTIRTDRLTLAEDKKEVKHITARAELHGSSVLWEAPDSALHELASQIFELAGDRPVFQKAAQLGDNRLQQDSKDTEIRWA